MAVVHAVGQLANLPQDAGRRNGFDHRALLRTFDRGALQGEKTPHEPLGSAG